MVYIHWQATELAASPERTKWQIHATNMTKSACSTSAFSNNLNYEAQWDNQTGYDIGRHEIFSNITLYRLTLSRKGTIVLYVWDVCLPQGETPTTESIWERVSQ